MKDKYLILGKLKLDVFEYLSSCGFEGSVINKIINPISKIRNSYGDAFSPEEILLWNIQELEISIKKEFGVQWDVSMIGCWDRRNSKS